MNNKEMFEKGILTVMGAGLVTNLECYYQHLVFWEF